MTAIKYEIPDFQKALNIKKDIKDIYWEELYGIMSTLAKQDFIYYLNAWDIFSLNKLVDSLSRKVYRLKNPFIVIWLLQKTINYFIDNNAPDYLRDYIYTNLNTFYQNLSMIAFERGDYKTSLQIIMNWVNYFSELEWVWISYVSPFISWLFDNIEKIWELFHKNFYSDLTINRYIISYEILSEIIESVFACWADDVLDEWKDRKTKLLDDLSMFRDWEQLYIRNKLWFN